MHGYSCLDTNRLLLLALPPSTLLGMLLLWSWVVLTDCWGADMGERQGLVHIRQLWKHVLQVTTAMTNEA